MRRRALLVVGALALAGLGAGASLDGTLVYYATPAEVAGTTSAGPLRVSGEVVPGTLRRSGDGVRFVMADGGRRVVVRSTTAAPPTLREGEDAVVEGTLDRYGTLRATQVLVRHSNVYVADDAPDGRR